MAFFHSIKTIVPEFLDDVLGVVVRICAMSTDTVRIRRYTGHRRSFSGGTGGKIDAAKYASSALTFFPWVIVPTPHADNLTRATFTHFGDG
jgi:hypothetical protein